MDVKNCGKIATLRCQSQRQKLRKNCDFEVSVATLSHEMDVGRQKLWKIAILLSQSQPLRTKYTLDVKN